MTSKMEDDLDDTGGGGLGLDGTYDGSDAVAFLPEGGVTSFGYDRELAAGDVVGHDLHHRRRGCRHYRHVSKLGLLVLAGSGSSSCNRQSLPKLGG